MGVCHMGLRKTLVDFVCPCEGCLLNPCALPGSYPCLLHSVVFAQVYSKLSYDQCDHQYDAASLDKGKDHAEMVMVLATSSSLHVK